MGLGALQILMACIKGRDNVCRFRLIQLSGGQLMDHFRMSYRTCVFRDKIGNDFLISPTLYMYGSIGCFLVCYNHLAFLDLMNRMVVSTSSISLVPTCLAL